MPAANANLPSAALVARVIALVLVAVFLQIVAISQFPIFGATVSAQVNTAGSGG